MTPAERAKRDADSVFRWITIHADKPRKADKPPVKEEKPPTVVRLKPPAATPVAATAAPAAPGVAPAAAPVLASNAPAAKPDAATPASSPGSTPATAAELVAQRAPVSAPSAAVVNAPPVAAEEEDAGDTLTLVSQVEPKFPISVVRSQRSGQVQVRFTVLTDGSVSDVNVVTTSNMRLNSAALAAVAQWRFAPVRKPQQGVVDLGFTNPD